jgi:hypothetical protein
LKIEGFIQAESLAPDPLLENDPAEFNPLGISGHIKLNLTGLVVLFQGEIHALDSDDDLFVAQLTYFTQETHEIFVAQGARNSHLMASIDANVAIRACIVFCFFDQLNEHGQPPCPIQDYENSRLL